MHPKIRVMNYTLVVADKKDQELLDRGFPFEKFVLGSKISDAALELKVIKPDLGLETCIAKIEPVHIHAARDHLVLTNPSILDIQEDEADILYESVKDIFQEMALNVYRPKPQQWFIECPNFHSLSTVSLHQAEGRNIDYWMPQDTDKSGVARQWRKWQNEIQMIWFNHPVNQKRQSEDKLAINSIWISGVGRLSDIDPNMSIQSAKCLHSPDNGLYPIANHLGKIHYSKLTSEQLANTLSLVHLDDSISEKIWAMAINALKNKYIEFIDLIDFPDGKKRIRQISKSDFSKKGFAFWKKLKEPTLQEMLSR
jgi:hypothetical protein